MEELATIRLNGMRILAFGNALFCALIAIGGIWAGSGVVPIMLALAVGVLPVWMALQGKADPASRLVMASSVVTYPMVLLYQWAGNAWMIDIHMMFFAALAVVAVMADWRPVIAGAGVIAAHHLLTNLIAPALVFNGNGDLGRVVLHAVIVVAETGVLVFLCVQLEAMIVGQAETRRAKEAAEIAAAAERARVEAEQAMVINAIGTRLEALSAGDLASRIATPFPASYESLRTSFNHAVADLDAMVGKVTEAVVQINSGSSEIRAASDDLARRTEEQASSLEQNSATTSRLTGKIEATARNAGDVNRAIISAQDDAGAGGEVVERAIAAMTEIERSASEIAKIITIIDGIAFQTNLLALNAGVEAARAGDAGRGFAVVANEVRALAQRSADAARDIKALITASAGQVSQGVSLVGETGSVLRGIVDQVIGIGTAISDISEEARVQATELKTVSDTFAKIDRVTQQNAAMVEESTAAAHNLLLAADAMSRLVGRFSTSGSAVSGNARDAHEQRWANAA